MYLQIWPKRVTHVLQNGESQKQFTGMRKK